MLFIKLYATALIIFLIIDMLWLGLIAKKRYQNQLGPLLKRDVNWLAAIVFYLIFIGGLTFFVLFPAWERQSLLYAFLVGGLFGFITYATYDLTNLATLKNWPWPITLIDLSWGTFLGASTASLSYLITLLTS